MTTDHHAPSPLVCSLTASAWAAMTRKSNPLAAAELPTLAALFDGRPLTASSGRFSHGDAHLIPTDVHLGVPGRPQSVTGQTAILTGVNAPAWGSITVHGRTSV